MYKGILYGSHPQANEQNHKIDLPSKQSILCLAKSMDCVDFYSLVYQWSINKKTKALDIEAPSPIITYGAILQYSHNNSSISEPLPLWSHCQWD